MDDLIRDHSPENREKLRRAGLSQNSELLPNQVRRLDALEVTDRMTERAIRMAIMQGSNPTTGGVIVNKERRPSTGEQAVAMLRERGPMHYRDLAEALVKEGKVTPRGKTFAQTLSAELSRRTDDVKRVAPGVYKATDAEPQQHAVGIEDAIAAEVDSDG